MLSASVALAVVGLSGVLFVGSLLSQAALAVVTIGQGQLEIQTRGQSRTLLWCLGTLFQNAFYMSLPQRISSLSSESAAGVYVVVRFCAVHLNLLFLAMYGWLLMGFALIPIQGRADGFAKALRVAGLTFEQPRDPRIHGREVNLV